MGRSNARVHVSGKCMFTRGRVDDLCWIRGGSSWEPVDIALGSALNTKNLSRFFKDRLVTSLLVNSLPWARAA